MQSEEGTTAIEYAMIASLVSIAIISGLTAVADKMRVFDTIWAALADAAM